MMIIKIKKIWEQNNIFFVTKINLLDYYKFQGAKFQGDICT